MDRIVCVTILWCVFLSTALLAQKPTATEPKPVAAGGASTTGPGGLPLRSYEFDVVMVDSTGSIANRRKGQARYYVEDVNGVALEMVEIPGGTFLMGTAEAEADEVKREYERPCSELFKGCGKNAEVAWKQSRWEVPQHSVNVPAFYMGKFEVTQAQWRAACELPKVNKDLVCDLSNLPHTFKGDNLPVQQVSWEDATEFCERLSRATGRIYRLPTEAEWEYAARGGTTTAFYFGDTITPELVNYDGNYPYGSAPKETSRQTTTPVGSLGYPNAFGLYDMHGNVLEWCMDAWHDSYNGAPSDGTSWETAGDTRRRMLRGGSYYHDGNHSRAAMRIPAPQDVRSPSTGFRVVAVAAAETDEEVARLLIDMARQWLEANMTHDPSILEKMLADDYQIMRADGRFSTKSEEIARLKSPNPSCKLESDHLDDAKVRVFGDVAVLYGWESFVVRCTDKVKTGTYFWSDVWLKRSGRWQAVAGIEPPPMAVSPLLPTPK